MHTSAPLAPNKASVGNISNSNQRNKDNMHQSVKTQLQKVHQAYTQEQPSSDRAESSQPRRYTLPELSPIDSVQVVLNVGGYFYNTRVCTLLMRSPGFITQQRRRNRTTKPSNTPRDRNKKRTSGSPRDVHDASVEEKSSVSNNTGYLGELVAQELSKYPDNPPSSISLFVDRDGLHFRYILNYLRDGQVVLPSDPTLLTELLNEATFYRLDHLAQVLRSESKKLQFGKKSRRWKHSPRTGATAAVILTPMQELSLMARAVSDNTKRCPPSDIEDLALRPLARANTEGALQTHSNSFTHEPSTCIFQRCACRELFPTLTEHLDRHQKSAKKAHSAIPKLTPARDNAATREVKTRENIAKREAKMKVAQTKTAKPSAATAPLLTKTKPKSSVLLYKDPRKNILSWDEIKTHNTVDSCWLVVKGKVYDVTTFLKIHPAGAKSIVRHGGTDATRDFNFHSSLAQKMWKEFEIGRVEGTESNCLIM